MATLSKQQLYAMQQAIDEWRQWREKVEIFGGFAFLIGLVALAATSLAIAPFLSIPVAIVSFIAGFCSIFYVEKQAGHFNKQQVLLDKQEELSGQNVSETHAKVLSLGLKQSRDEESLRKLSLLQEGSVKSPNRTSHSESTQQDEESLRRLNHLPTIIEGDQESLSPLSSLTPKGTGTFSSPANATPDKQQEHNSDEKVDDALTISHPTTP